MDDFDELLGSLQSNTTPQPAAETVPAGAFSVDDDFDALLDSLVVPEQSATAPQESAPAEAVQGPVSGDAKPAAAAQWTSLQDKEQQDFMAWLEGEDEQQQKQLAVQPAVEKLEGQGVVEQKEVEKAPPLHADMVVHSPDHRSVTAKVPTVQDLNALLESSFVDVETLRTMCLRLGTIPKALRTQVWSYLLSGQSQPDVQADMWRYDSSKIQNAGALEADCEAAAQATLEKFKDHEDFSLMTNLGNDLKDIISLYCVRKNLPYHPTYLSTLLPLLTPPCSMSRPQASLCLYALCSHLFPIIGLSPEASNLGLQKYHSWMRLLLSYHFPALAQHLDRVLPHWERAACDSFTAVSLPDESQTASDSTSTASDSNSPGSRSAENVTDVPLAWTCGFFAGCLPPAEQISLWDWGIVQGNKYASLYLTVALFGVFADSLLLLDGSEVSRWMAAVSAGQDDWHLLHPSRMSGTKDQHLTMQQFVTAWIAGASWIRGHTPHSFQEALEGLEGWAVHAASQTVAARGPERQQRQQSSASSSKSEGSDLDAGLNTLFNAFSKLSTFATANVAGPATTPTATQQGTISQVSSAATTPSQQHSRAASTRMCLWTTAQDAVAQLCVSGNRSATAAQVQSFADAVTDRLSREAEEYPDCKPINRLTTKLQVTRLSDPQPGIRYFGIDCRPTSFLRYGRFATSYHFDPLNLHEPDAIANMLETLEPLRGSVHFCLIGSGEALIRHEHSSNADALNHALSDARSQLNAMAMFLLKRNFPFVSVLQGGFSAAATFIAQGKAPRGVDTLVDANLPALGRAIGVSIPSVEPRNSPPPTETLRDMFTTVNTTEILDDIGEKFKSTFASLKKFSAGSFSGPSILRSTESTPRPQQQQEAQPQTAAHAPSTPSPTFVIGGDDDDDDWLESGDARPRTPPPTNLVAEEDSTTVSVTKTEAEKQFALAQHRLSGLQKADTIVIAKENFPGSILFPAIKYKYVDENEDEAIQAHRFLVVTPERLIVLDSGGGGVGSTALVKSNHHLTELLKMTFRKKDPDLVSIYYARGPGEPPRVNRYRISKKNEFVEVLQRNTAKFR